MASIAITASICTAYSCNLEVQKKPSSSSPVSQTSSSGTKKDTRVITPYNLEGHDHLNSTRKEQNPVPLNKKSNQAKEEIQYAADTEHSVPKFFDERWKHRTWDLNMFVEQGRMDWDAVIVAEARRRRFLELYPEVATSQEPVLSRSSVVPWWAWITHSHLPEAELPNCQLPDHQHKHTSTLSNLTHKRMPNRQFLLCKAVLLATVIGIVLFRKRQDFGNLQKLAEEATFYDMQWQASWQDQDSGTPTSKQGRIDV